MNEKWEENIRCESELKDNKTIPSIVLLKSVPLVTG